MILFKKKYIYAFYLSVALKNNPISQNPGSAPVMSVYLILVNERLL